ncbi:MAG: Mercuric reductase [Candidatus Uhrbacteria bacterium GW2011_GWF2_41_430]|nr:MAG: Mercuric reductase [Candidatus Uhrbacteria bacterium GW2011_GWF2_41_430]
MNKKGGKKFSEKNVVFDCDVLVIGSGAAGISAAFSARGSGKKVIIIEQDKVGGECPNYACVPTIKLTIF